MHLFVQAECVNQRHPREIMLPTLILKRGSSHMCSYTDHSSVFVIFSLSQPPTHVSHPPLPHPLAWSSHSIPTASAVIIHPDLPHTQSFRPKVHARQWQESLPKRNIRVPTTAQCTTKDYITTSHRTTKDRRSQISTLSAGLSDNQQVGRYAMATY